MGRVFGIPFLWHIPSKSLCHGRLLRLAGRSEPWLLARRPFKRQDYYSPGSHITYIYIHINIYIYKHVYMHALQAYIYIYVYTQIYGCLYTHAYLHKQCYS